VTDRLLSRTGLVAAWVLLVAVQLPIREVMPPDEPRYAEQAESMKTSGDWIVPRDGDEVLVEKPPALFWSVTLASLPFDRVTETTARVPSAIAALVVLLLTARVGAGCGARTPSDTAARSSPSPASNSSRSPSGARATC